MSSFVCAISGVYPEEPVISNTGYIFEKRVIEKYLKANGDCCPITGNPLTVENLTQIKGMYFFLVIARFRQFHVLFPPSQ